LLKCLSKNLFDFLVQF